MRYIDINNEVYQLNIDKKTNIKLEGHYGIWNIIEVMCFEGNFYGLLEHNSFGDETAYQIVQLNNSSYRNFWLTKEGFEDRKMLWIPQNRILGETYDDFIGEMQELGYFKDYSDDNIEKFFLTEQQINNI